MLTWSCGCIREGQTAEPGRSFVKAAVSPEKGQQVCLSLRALAVARDQDSNRPPRDECLNLGGIGWLEAYVVDVDNADVILVGRSSPGWPTLCLDDLAVNIRNVWDEQPYPHCSLDPRPEDIVKLNRLMAGAGNIQTLEGIRALHKQVQAAWGPQTTRVGGVPPESRHGRVMIDADYHMKGVGLGLTPLDGLASYPDRMVESVRESIRGGNGVPRMGMSMARFWFHVADGDPKFAEGNGIVSLESCKVILLTERQMAAADGQLRDAKEDDPHALSFAADFTKGLRRFVPAIPVYADLENLFRLHSLVRAMRFRNAPGEAGLDLGFYRKRCRMQMEKRMPAGKAGQTNCQEIQVAVPGGAILLFPMACGGVSMEIPTTDRQFSRGGDLTMSLRAAVLKSRPSKDALTWPVDSR